MTVDQRVTALRQLMAERNISLYIIPTSDDHASEYVGEHFKARQYMTGFTGSAGTAVITQEEAGLWADGRYFVQAEAELEGSCVTLYRIHEPGVPKVSEYVEQHLAQGGIIGFDGSCMTTEDYRKYLAICEKCQGSIAMEEDLVGLIWEGRPAMSCEEPWLLRSKYSGRPASEKLADIRSQMAEKGCNLHLVASLYDIAWILNLRGSDIANVPVVTSFLIITSEQARLYCFSDNWPEAVMEQLAKLGVEARPYGAIYAELSGLCAGSQGVLLDESTVNARLLAAMGPEVRLVNAPNPSELMRSIKNEVEIMNTIQAHIQDGVAVDKFIR